MSRSYILRDDITWLTELDQLQARERARAEGFGDALDAALEDASCHELATVDISMLPAWAQEKFQAWFGET